MNTISPQNSSPPLQRHPIVESAREGHAQLEELDDNVAELAEEDVVVLGVALDVFPEFLVLDQRHVGREHHEGFGGYVFVLAGSVPLFLFGDGSVSLLFSCISVERDSSFSKQELKRRTFLKSHFSFNSKR